MTARIPLNEALPAWREAGACRGKPVAWWYPNSHTAAYGMARAHKLCAACPVRRECFTWAMDTDQQFGVWGGVTAERRDKLRTRWHNGDRRIPPVYQEAT